MDKLEDLTRTPSMVGSKIKHLGAKFQLLGLQQVHDNFVAVGEIYNDSRFEEGTTVYTSVVEYINFLTGELKTRNTLYKLIP